MTFNNYSLVVASICLALITPLKAETPLANTIEAINVVQQGNEIAVKIDLKEALTSPPAGFSIANPAKRKYHVTGCTRSFKHRGQSCSIVAQIFHPRQT